MLFFLVDSLNSPLYLVLMSERRRHPFPLKLAPREVQVNPSLEDIMSVRVRCIKKASGDHENPYVAISTIGWQNPATGESGRSTRLEMYDWVVKGGHAYVEASGYQARLVDAISPSGNKYVRTQSDSTQADNLLKLPECA